MVASTTIPEEVAVSLAGMVVYLCLERNVTRYAGSLVGRSAGRDARPCSDGLGVVCIILISDRSSQSVFLQSRM